MADPWYYRSGNQVIGPVDNRTLKNAARAGDITPTTFVRRGDFGEWVVASRVKGLFAPAPPNATSFPPPLQLTKEVGLPPVISAKIVEPTSADHSRHRSRFPRWATFVGTFLAGVFITCGFALLVANWPSNETRQRNSQSVSAQAPQSDTNEVEDADAALESWSQFVAAAKKRVTEAEAAAPKGAGGKTIVLKFVSDDVKKADSIKYRYVGVVILDAEERSSGRFLMHESYRVTFGLVKGKWQYMRCEEKILSTTIEDDKKLIGSDYFTTMHPSIYVSLRKLL